jgi:hypothetical protein
VSTRYWIYTLIGLVICGLAIIAVDWGIYHLVRTGSCGSSPTYISRRPCPPETGGHILALIGGIFGGLIGIGLYAARGKGGRPSTIGLGLIMWSLLFITLAGAVWLAAFGPANNDDPGARAAAVILAVIFIPMGLAPLPFALFGRGKRQRALQLVQHGQRCPGEVMSVEDTNVTINDNPRVRITVQAQPPGEPPFTIVKTTTVSRVNIPRRGDRCTVFYDPSDRENRNGITFDPVPAGFGPPVATGGFGGVGGVSVGGTGGVPGFTPPPTAGAGPPFTPPAATPPPAAPIPGFSPPPPTPSPIPGFGPPGGINPGAAAGDDDDDEDPIVKLERLGKLRERGLLTEAEFEEQKRRLLGEV